MNNAIMLLLLYVLYPPSWNCRTLVNQTKTRLDDRIRECQICAVVLFRCHTYIYQTLYIVHC